MTNRIGGPGPSEPSKGPRGPTEPDSDKFKKKVEKIEEVGESELEKRRKKPFYETQEEENGEKNSSKAPSPFERDFMAGKTSSRSLNKPLKGLRDLSNESIPTPPHSPPPPLNNTPASANELDNAEEDLPHSDDFWKKVDMPDAPPPAKTFEEKSDHSHKGARQEHSSKKEDESPFALFEKKKEKKESDLFSPLERKEKRLDEWKERKEREINIPHEKKRHSDLKKEEHQEKRPLLDRAPPSSDKNKSHIQRPEPEKKEKKTINAPLPSKGKKEAKEEESEISLPPPPPVAAPMQGAKKQEKKDLDSAPPIHVPHPLPPLIQQAAQAAQVQATPYLNPKTEALYHELVGSIMYVASQHTGVSVTQVVLNSPNLQHSVFFNSTITIEKYASAPDSFNVRLAGTPQAVQAFNQNIQGLTTAFNAAYEDKRIQFRIGRLETSYAPERHSIRRKEETSSQDEEDLPEG